MNELKKKCLLITFFIYMCKCAFTYGKPETYNHALNELVYSECGGVLKNPKGVISTPNFPNPYPVPINCRWVIEAPTEKVIAVYFTQFYMREGLTITEYAFYSESMYMGKKEFGMVSSDHEPTYLVSNKPVLVLDFSVRESGNIHMRIREYLLDIFGFNITYEVVDRNDTVHRDGCIYNHCSFTGYCFASATFSEYVCSCFEGFYGTECHYSSGCEPGSESNCQNGGTCRFSIGSTVTTCECPSGFEGSKCEKRTSDRKLLAQCISIGCTQTCGLTNHGDYKCTCMSGFHLIKDKKTCVEKGRTRYLVSFKLYDQNVDLAHLDSTRYNQLKKGIENALLQLFQPRLYKAENLTVLNFLPGAVVQFHFFGEKEDSHIAKSTMEDALKSKSIGKYAVDRNYISFEWEPALSIQSMDVSEKMPVVAGSELSLACVTQGSSAMEVRWFKDDSPINVHTSYRSMWTTMVPKNSKDQYTAVLGFEKVSLLDSGEFICQVTDWGVIQNKSMRISVVTVPQPLVTPITATVHKGDRQVITCLSQDDLIGRSGYNWLKNERILNPSVEPELVEDLYPTGSRLLIQSARASATYTCIITSTAGSNRKDSSVTVIMAKDTTPMCAAEKYLEVKWSKTAVNTENIQFCPKGYTGEVRRHCNLKTDNGATWGEPDYSRCLSSEFIAIKQKLESLRMGYIITDVGTLLLELKYFLWNMRDRFHIAEGEPVVDLLEGLHDYQQKHGKSDELQLRNNSQVFLDIVSFLLDTPRLIQKQSHVIKLHQQILSYGLLHGASVRGDNFYILQRSALVLEVGQIQNEGQRILKFPSRKPKRDVPSQPTWLTDSVELDFNTWIIDNLQDLNDSISIAVVFYKNFSAFLPERFLAQYGYGYGSILHRGQDVEYQLHSRIVAVAMQTGQRRVGSSKSSRLKVKARLAHLDRTVNRQIMWNISCGVADFSQGNVRFSMEGCQPVQTGNYSLCQCNYIGTYAVLLTTYAQQDALRYHNGFDVIAGIGCALCVFFIFLTFFILLVLWRKIRGAITVLKIQVCIALIGAYATILQAQQESITKEHYPYTVSVIQFFLLAAFSLQLCVGLTVYTEFVDMKGVRYPELKLATMGWAIPTIVVGATLAAQVHEGFRLNSWWIQIQTNHFYAFSISVLILTLLHIMLVMTIKSELNIHKKLETSKHSKIVNRSRLLNRSLVIILFLVIVSVSSILYINFEDEYYKYLFSSSSAILGFVIFLCYTVCSENAHLLCSSNQIIEEDDKKQELRLKGKSSSFQGFLKPEIVSDTFCSSKLHQDTIEIDVRMEKLHNLRFPICHPESIEWKEVDQLLVQKSSPILRDITVHHQTAPNIVEKLDCIDVEVRLREENVTPSFQLQQLDDSPRSSPYKDVEEMSQRPPDILEPTNRSYVPVHPFKVEQCDILEPTKQANVPVHPFKVEQCDILEQTKQSYVPVHPYKLEQCNVISSHDKTIAEVDRVVSHSTFRPLPEVQLNEQQMSARYDTLKVPDIGDEPILPTDLSTLRKKDKIGLQVMIPVPPGDTTSTGSSGSVDVDQSKKGWSITNV